MFLTGSRRWAAAFIESIWRRYGVTTTREDLHRMAIGTIGGLFDMIADWLLDADPGNPAHVQALITDLTNFHHLIHTALMTSAR